MLPSSDLPTVPGTDHELRPIIEANIQALQGNGWTTTHNENGTITIARTFTLSEITRLADPLPVYLFPEHIATLDDLTPASRERARLLLSK